MKIISILIAVTIQLISIAQKELTGLWELQYRGSSKTVDFDINDPSVLMKMPGQSNMAVNFQTDDDSLNKKMSSTSYDIFKNCTLEIINKTKFKRIDLIIANGICKNEEFYGSYYVDKEKNEIQFDVISSTGKNVISSAIFVYKIEDDILVLTSIENPDFQIRYKRHHRRD